MTNFRWAARWRHSIEGIIGRLQRLAGAGLLALLAAGPQTARAQDIFWGGSQGRHYGAGRLLSARPLWGAPDGASAYKFIINPRASTVS